MSENIVTSAVATKPTLTIGEFLINAEKFLNGKCPVGSGVAVNRKEVAVAGGLTEESDALISALINANFMPDWRIRQGRDGGVCRVGEEPNRGPNVNKYGSEWLACLMTCLNTVVSLDPKKPTPRDKVAYAMAALTGEEILKLPNKISEAISLGKCPGFASKRGAGIYRTGEVVEAPAVSAEGIDEAASETSSEVAETTEASTVEASTETPEVTDTSTDTSAETSESTEASQEASQEAAPETTPETAKAKGRKSRKG